MPRANGKKTLDSRQQRWQDGDIMKKRFIGQHCDTWEDALEYAEREANRIFRPVSVIEYREKPSPDDERFFEVVDDRTATVLRQNYEVLRQTEVRPDDRSLPLAARKMWN